LISTHPRPHYITLWLLLGVPHLLSLALGGHPFLFKDRPLAPIAIGMPDHASGKVSSLSGGRQSLLPPENLLFARGQRRRKTNLRHHRTKSLSAGSRKQTKAAAADDIPAGHLASSHAMRRLWLFTARSAALPGTASSWRFDGDPRRPTNPQRRGQLGIVSTDCIPPWQYGTANAQKPLPIPVAGSTIRVSESCPGRGRPRCCQPALH
jgi:hypothetical protein